MTTALLQTDTPLDVELNEAIRSIASALWPNGIIVSDDAPGTYDELKALLDTGHRPIVYSGGSKHTIYADPQVNYCLRAWHDYCHWQGQLPFTYEGEVLACSMQCHQLREKYGDNERTTRWCRILEAEIIGQAEYFRWHKRFPNDQRGFVEAYLRDRTSALLWSLF